MKKRFLGIITVCCILIGLISAGLVTLAGNSSNTLEIYYKGYATPYIHYKIGNGDWTTSPGVKLEENNEMDGFTHKITIDMGSSDSVTACFNDGNGNWDNNNTKDYTFNKGTYTFSNGTITKIDKELTLSVDTSDYSASYYQSMTKFDVHGGKAPYTIESTYEYPNSNGEMSTCKTTGTIECENSSYYDYITFGIGGIGKIYSKVTDANGDTVTYNSTFEIPAFEISGINYDLASPQKLGSTINMSAEYNNAFVPKYSLASANMLETFAISKNGSDYVETIYNNNELDAVWTPTEAGTYNITVNMTDAAGQKAEYTTTYIIKDNADNITTIYYNGFSNPYIHYKIGNGAWTSVPGIAMNSSSDITGFTHKATINLGDAENLTTCFNDGNNNWDNNNSKNYAFGVGTYTVSNGNIKEIDNALKVSINPICLFAGYNQSSFSYCVEGGTAPYTIKVGYTGKNINDKTVTGTGSGTVSKSGDTFISSWSFLNGGDYNIYAIVTDSTGKEVSTTETITIPKFVVTGINTDINSPQVIGSTINLSAIYEHPYIPKYSVDSVTLSETFTISKDGSNDSTVITCTNKNSDCAKWTPSEAGTYTISVSMKDSIGQTSSFSTKYVINKTIKNVVTVYYKGYDNPYIHYKIGNGSWTTVPGVAMTPTTEKPGYTHKIEIETGDADTITACFNDGNGNWNSNYGANYIFNVGENYFN